MLFAIVDLAIEVARHGMVVVHCESMRPHLLVRSWGEIDLQAEPASVMRWLRQFMGGPDDGLVVLHLRQRIAVVAMHHSDLLEIRVDLIPVRALQGRVHVTQLVAMALHLSGLVKVFVCLHCCVPQAWLICDGPKCTYTCVFGKREAVHSIAFDGMARSPGQMQDNVSQTRNSNTLTVTKCMHREW